jgi:NADH dehydrogenase
MLDDAVFDSKKRKVLIVGGGFAGLQCALDLASEPNIQITLLDRNNYQQFNPLLYQVAAGYLAPGNAAFALRDFVKDNPNIDVQMVEVRAIDLNKRSVTTSNGGEYSGDILVLATGSHVNFFSVPGAEKFSHPLYSLRDAEALKDVLYSGFEQADLGMATPRKDPLNIVIVGGGTTGVEMAGTVADMITRIIGREYRHLRPEMAKAYLVERNPLLLKGFSAASQNYAVSALRDKGVEVHLGTAVKEITEHSVLLSNGSTIAYDIVIWAAGLRTNLLQGVPSEAVHPNGRLRVAKDLTMDGLSDVFVAGDLANATDEQGNAYPQLAAVAKQAGQHCSRNIKRMIEGQELEPFDYKDRGILAMVGRNAAITELGGSHHQLSGSIAFATWLGIHAGLLPSVRARFEAIVEWAWVYFLGDHASQIIDRTGRLPDSSSAPTRNS